MPTWCCETVESLKGGMRQDNKERLSLGLDWQGIHGCSTEHTARQAVRLRNCKIGGSRFLGNLLTAMLHGFISLYGANSLIIPTYRSKKGGESQNGMSPLVRQATRRKAPEKLTLPVSRAWASCSSV